MTDLLCNSNLNNPLCACMYMYLPSEVTTWKKRKASTCELMSDQAELKNKFLCPLIRRLWSFLNKKVHETILCDNERPNTTHQPVVWCVHHRPACWMPVWLHIQWHHHTVLMLCMTEIVLTSEFSVSHTQIAQSSYY